MCGNRGAAAAMMPGDMLDETRDPGFIDLTINRPAAAGEEAIIAAALQRLAADPDLGRLLDYQAPAGRSEERAAAAAFLERFGLTTSPETSRDDGRRPARDGLRHRAP